MKPIIGFLVVAVLAAIVPAQTKAPAPMTAMKQDTVQQAKAAPEQNAQQYGWHERGFLGFGKEHGPMFGCQMQPHFPGAMGPACGLCCMPHRGMHGLIGRHPCRVLFLGLFVMGLINVLLTIIVSLDMARLGKFKGLWVPIILLAGIPGSIIYALLRIADSIDHFNVK